MGLGPVADMPLKDARVKAAGYRNQLADGLDPIEERDAAQRAQTLAAAKAISFRTCCERYITAHEGSWRNEKHRQQWRNMLATYAYRELGDFPVQAIDTPLVLKVLQQPVVGTDPETGKEIQRPLWSAKTETAGRVRGRIEAVLDWAKITELREGTKSGRVARASSACSPEAYQSPARGTP